MGIQDTWNSAKQAVNATVDKWAVKPNMGSTRGDTITSGWTALRMVLKNIVFPVIHIHLI
jgi:hypothetical protein